MDECEDISMWINNLVDYYPSFSEGWGLYAENPILMEDLDILKDDGFSKYGALKWQVSNTDNNLITYTTTLTLPMVEVVIRIQNVPLYARKVVSTSIQRPQRWDDIVCALGPVLPVFTRNLLH